MWILSYHLNILAFFSSAVAAAPTGVAAAALAACAVSVSLLFVTLGESCPV